ncbi:PorP/SprF family type IX secretion system membrane protein [Algibacter luteus]|uniref:Type IX secretion system membrane protein, PorP/SprF family n=1 Tax=Algibacter luteus TaxID=1178825 RepID=A0A1M6CJ62_9FLAO|nr:type IX secretion system membrane protein PorP/SprF [Algibacter luteus]WJJ96049.1 type IX secretion system membrane protein PorP/SprF [Algibacter luteus]SHI61037.1 type IX secretion system membrane protein, PorP/SprF family [Algibacter luteus]
MIKKSSLIKSLILVVFTALLSIETEAQQDPQFTHYMYNTMSVNPGYAGQRNTLSATALYRTQWVGIDGAPKTMTFGIHSPLRNDRIGLGLNVVSDQLGPAEETSIDANFSYSIPVNESGDLELSFGIKGGLHLLDTDWSKGRYQNEDNAFNENINLISPTLGAGLYLHSEKWYLGFAVPNILNTEHYDDFQESIATERLHYFLIGGYVFNLSDNTKLKPAFLVKGVSGAPVIADLSANALFNEKFTLGLAYRWDDSVSGLVGFQLSPEIFIGYAYDATTTALNNYNSGTHEIMLRFELQQIAKILSPRFF